MPTFYRYTEGGQVYALDDAFVSADAFRQGGLYNWGRNDLGTLGINNTTSPICTPVTTSAGGANWKQVSGCSAGANLHTAAIKTDGTLWIWGYNELGALGINATGVANGRTTPVTTFAGGTNWKQVACGNYQTAAIKTDGTLWTWGRGFFGVLGDNTTTDKLTPVTTFAGGTNWKQVSCNSNFTAAIKTDGTLWTWGNNASAQLGTNDTNNRTTPVTTFAGGTNWKQIVCVTFGIAAIKTDGTLWSWGDNTYGQLGINAAGTTLGRSTPVTTFVGGTNWKQVSGGHHTAAIKTDGTLWTWGRNGYAQLGTNDTGMRCTPVTTFAGGTNWKQVACGYSHIAAIKTDGTLWTWGRNFYGRLGVNDAGSTLNRSTPVTTFAGGTNWKQVSCGTDSTAAVTYIDDYQ
jgi:hypothetical protein